MKERNQDSRPEQVWEVMDVLDLKYDAETFDIIIDKSTIDAIFCSDNSHLSVATMLKECQRVLKTKGYYIAISNSGPENRESHFLRDHLKFKVTKVDLDTRIIAYWVYICQK